MSRVVIRPFSATDSAGTCELFRRVYGDHYVSPDVYMPQMISQHNLQGRWQSLVAVIGDHVVGHAALCRQQPASQDAELALVAVDPNLQGAQIATRLGEQLLNRRQALGLARLSIKQVTSHRYSQRLAQRLGFHDTGLLPDFVPSPFATGRAETIVIGCQVSGGNDRPLPHLQWPAQYQWLMDPLASQFGTTLDETPTAIQPLRVSHLPGRIDIVAERMDACLVGQLRHLPAHWPLSVRLGLGRHFCTDYRLLMAAGFFFTGIMPNESTQRWQALFHRIAQVRRLTLDSAPMQRLHDELQAHAQAWKNTQASSAA
ncbi:GNAT family N-acetyltransferase [Pseudomonas sp. Z5-35]|uniref:GNAT family N-acetyltransferase n=1 Tax=unclassified Pseudomonas TaxID=196821 RepID=UPI003DA8D3B2